MTDSRVVAGGPEFYRLAPDSDVGGEVYERMLLERLPAHGVDIVVGLPRDHAVRPVPAGWTVDVLRHARGLHWTLAPVIFMPYVRRLIRDGKVNLLRGQSVRYTGPSLLWARALTRARVPVVIHHHHLSGRWAGLESAIVRAADAVVTVSQHSRSELISAGADPDKLHVVLQGVARPPASEGRLEAWSSDGLRLLHLGRLEPRKQPWIAIDAVASLRRSGVPASLVLAGAGPLEPELVRRASALGVGDRVRFTGRVTEADKWRLYDSADVLLFTSSVEGFGRVVAEAQSRGVPAIAAEGTATAETLDPDRSGFLVAANGDAFAARVRDLSDDPLRRRMSAHARAFGARFDWSTTAAEVAEIYRAAVQTRSRA